jgi:hypothetical protein
MNGNSYGTTYVNYVANTSVLQTSLWIRHNWRSVHSLKSLHTVQTLPKMSAKVPVIRHCYTKRLGNTVSARIAGDMASLDDESSVSRHTQKSGRINIPRHPSSSPDNSRDIPNEKKAMQTRYDVTRDRRWRVRQARRNASYERERNTTSVTSGVQRYNWYHECTCHQSCTVWLVG